MICGICKKEFEPHHFNQKYCCDECKKEAIRQTKARYKKTEKGIASEMRWRNSEQKKITDKRYWQSEKGRKKAPGLHTFDSSPCRTSVHRQPYRFRGGSPGQSGNGAVPEQKAAADAAHPGSRHCRPLGHRLAVGQLRAGPVSYHLPDGKYLCRSSAVLGGRAAAAFAVSLRYGFFRLPVCPAKRADRCVFRSVRPQRFFAASAGRWLCAGGAVLRRGHPVVFPENRPRFG